MRIIIYLVMLTIVASCAKIDAAKYGKVSLYKSTSKSPTFLFKVEESYVAKTIDSSKDDDHPLLSEAQANLLNQILINQKLCLDEYNYPKFTITSKQQRIYDVTFANLIDQSYNAKPVTPLTFFGKCVK